MKTYIFLLISLLIGSFCFSQEQKTTNHIFPVSIYTFNFNHKTPLANVASFSNDLNFSNTFKLLTISFENINKYRFLISDDTLTSNPALLIYEDYKSYRDENLLKGFVEKYDITRWNSCNFRQPEVN